MEAHFMGLEGDTVVQELVDIILMEDRSMSPKTCSLGLIFLASKQVCSLLCLIIQFFRLHIFIF